MPLILLAKGGILASLYFLIKSHPEKVIAFSHEATLIGSSLLIILYVAGVKRGLRWVGILFVVNILVRTLIGGE